MTDQLHPDLRGSLWSALLSIATSSSTLICCALPALLVAIGAGATLAGLVTAVPQLIWLSTHKALVFGSAGVMLAIAGGLQYALVSRLARQMRGLLPLACGLVGPVWAFTWSRWRSSDSGVLRVRAAQHWLICPGSNAARPNVGWAAVSSGL